MQLAAKNGHLSIVKYLLSKGADIHADNDEALRYALQNNHFKTAEYLLDHGANPNAEDEDGPILQLLIEKNQLKLAAKAVSYGADTSILSPEDQQKLERHLVVNKMAKKRCL